MIYCRGGTDATLFDWLKQKKLLHWILVDYLAASLIAEYGPISLYLLTMDKDTIALLTLIVYCFSF